MDDDEAHAVELRDLNRELIREHQKRVENHEALLAALREVNQTIQKAAKLRAGGPKTKMVAACRQAIKVNNVHALFKIIQLGGTSRNKPRDSSK